MYVLPQMDLSLSLYVVFSAFDYSTVQIQGV